MSDDIADREHPVAKKLSAYQANELSPQENDAIQEHLANCRLCAERLLDLQRFLDFKPDPSLKEVADLETAGEWKRLRQRLERERTGSRTRSVTGTGRSRRVFGSPKTAYALAAVLAFAVVGLSAYTWRLWQELHGIEINARHVFLPSITGVRGLDSVRIIDLDPHQETLITFSLEGPQEGSYSAYRLEVRDSKGRPIVARDELRMHDGSFVFTLFTDGLATGRYSVKVQGLQRGRPPEEVGEYAFILRRPKPS